MSLFPAYSTDVISNSEASVPATKNELSWLANQSFIPFPSSTSREQETSESDKSPEPSNSSKRQDNRKHKKKKRKHHKKRKQASSSEDDNTSKDPEPIRISELDYYTDLEGLRIYLTVETLHRPACPRYRLGPYRFKMNSGFNVDRAQRFYRYFKKAKKLKVDDEKSSQDTRNVEFELEKAARLDDSVEKWIEYIRYKEDNPVHFDSYQNHKAELAIIEKAMRHHPDDGRLLSLYLEGIVKVFPTDQVLVMIEKMIAKDNTNVLLWDALIDNKQSAMAQCIVPNVLKLYEKSIPSLFMAKRNDEVMLKFFKKCAIFCRQAGLWELFFGFMQMTIGINVSTNFADGKDLFASPEHFTQLIEYEELILKSGLPMNEIWLRIEKLRGAFHFLPYRGSNMCSDPQRMVLNQDIVGFVYPLINREYTFDLVILILKLMKYPFESNAFERCSFFKAEPYESDHSEQLLPLFLDLNRSRKNDPIILNLIKELNTPPSFINTNLAFESYLELMRELLVVASEHFSDEKNIILLLLYLKLERILIVFDKTAEALSEQRKKSSRSRVKNLLKKSKYQNELSLYIEYGLIEYELDGLSENCLKVFNLSVQVFCSQHDQLCDNDIFTLVLKMTEILLKLHQKPQAIYLLTKLALNPKEINFNAMDEQTRDSIKLLALQKLNERVTRLVQDDSQGELMQLEQYFIVNPLINSLKAYLYYLAMIKSKSETIKKLEGFLFHFNNPDNQKHTYIREQIFEIYLKIVEFRTEEFTNNCLLQVVDRVLHEYPENLTAIRMCSFSEFLSWFQIRTILGKHLTVRSVLLMTVAGRVRDLYLTKATLLENQREGDTYKRRILNLLKHAVRRESSLRQNALLWRLYLRELFDQPTAVGGSTDNVLEQCRKTLYMALEACPWNKSLYLDGAFFAPPELAHLLDLLMEKQLRLHAIPEELEILRNE
ncbi:nuclear exosome regulator NRDE2 [Topomyia yanbarensis]|uniref:nuclear exosome regulator NRDE2 n=1 Tax=Topomyia yanbarensis TaxID=2498891 RepID=UPI00273ABF49|nr:nuclear exosome regulator NRDE2 [Topomyia yanbarensis]